MRFFFYKRKLWLLSITVRKRAFEANERGRRRCDNRRGHRCDASSRSAVNHSDKYGCDENQPGKVMRHPRHLRDYSDRCWDLRSDNRCSSKSRSECRWRELDDPRCRAGRGNVNGIGLRDRDRTHNQRKIPARRWYEYTHDAAKSGQINFPARNISRNDEIVVYEYAIAAKPCHFVQRTRDCNAAEPMLLNS